MPPKQDKIDRPYGLSDGEMKAALSVLRLLAIDGNTPVDKIALAKLTGHDKANTAVKLWSMAKAKLIAVDAADASEDSVPGAAAPSAVAGPNTKPAKRGRPAGKAKASAAKKVEVPEEDEEDGDERDVDEPAPKRSKTKGKGKARDDSV